MIIRYTSPLFKTNTNAYIEKPPAHDSSNNCLLEKVKNGFK